MNFASNIKVFPWWQFFDSLSTEYKTKEEIILIQSEDLSQILTVVIGKKGVVVKLAIQKIKKSYKNKHGG